MRKNKGKEKYRHSLQSDSIVPPALDVWYSCTAYIEVRPPPYFFCLGRRPCMTEIIYTDTHPRTNRAQRLTTRLVDSKVYMQQKIKLDSQLTTGAVTMCVKCDNDTYN